MTRYPRMRVRFRTTGAATARVDVGAVTVMVETAAATTFKIVDFPLTGVVTTDVVKLYACDGVGAVYYDWVMVYAGNFTIPNVVSLDYRQPSRNLHIPIPGRIPNLTQNLGGDDATIEMVCDLDVETSSTAGTAGAWKRTSDYDAGDIFLDVSHNHSVRMPWQYLVFGNKEMRVTLDEPEFNYGGENKVRLTFHADSDRNM